MEEHTSKEIKRGEVVTQRDSEGMWVSSGEYENAG